MEIKMNVTVYNLDLPLGKRLKAVHDMGLKKGDEVTITFNDGQVETVKIKRIGFMERQTTNNRLIENFYIEDCAGCRWNLYTASTIRIDKRNPRSKKVLTDDLKQFHNRMEYELDRLKEVKKVAERRNRVNARIQAYKEKAREELHQAEEKLAGRKSSLTRKKAIEVVLKDKGYELGCWDDFLNELSVASIKQIMWAVDCGDATDVVIRHNMKDYVVSVDFVDSEVDFTSYTKAEYISRYGSEKFED